MTRDLKDLKKQSKFPFMRDVMVDVICSNLENNKNLFFLNVDQGSPNLDKYKEKYPKNIVHCGISEQNMMTVGCGLALEKNKVFCYGMAPFVTARCFEQIKISLASLNVPVCIIGAGPGLGYADAGPTHYATEDIGLMYTLPNCIIYTPSDWISCKVLTNKIINENNLTYLRIDRDAYPSVYERKDINYYDTTFKKGFNEIVNGEKVCVISSGYLLHKILDIYQSKPQINFGIIDFYQHNPINKKELNKVLDKYGKIIIVDEQTEKINTSTIIKNISSADNSSKIKSFNLKDRFVFENGGRDYLLEKNGISFKNIASEINI